LFFTFTFTFTFTFEFDAVVEAEIIYTEC